MEKYAIDLAKYRIKKAKEKLKSARDLLSHNDNEDSISRSYYAIFSAARALLALKQLDSKKHSGVISLFNQHFVKKGTVSKVCGAILKNAKIYREKADYGDFVKFSSDLSRKQIKDAEIFVKEIRRTIKKLIQKQKG